MITWKHGDIFDAQAYAICHQVNCQGVMGSGIAKQIKQNYPNVYKTYRMWYETDNLKLGTVVNAYTNKDNIHLVANLCSQDRYGRDNKRYTNYTAFRQCLQQIANTYPPDCILAFPYKIGCGLGGGDWETIYKMIQQELSNHNVEIWKREED